MQILSSWLAAVVLVAVAGIVPQVDGLTAAVVKDPPKPSFLLDSLSPCPGAAGCKDQLLAVQIGKAVVVASSENPEGIVTEAERPQGIVAEAKKVDPAGPSRNAVWVQQVVLRGTLFLAAFLFLCGYATLLYNRSYPDEDAGKAYLTDDDDGPVNAPDTGRTDVEDGLSEKSEVTGSSKTFADSMASALAPTTPDVKRTYSMYLRKGECVSKGAEELIEQVGISAMCILPGAAHGGITKMQRRHSVPLIAFQANLLQIAMLYFLATQLVPREDLHKHFEELPKSIVCIAIYLHFLNCMGEMPYHWQLFMHLSDFHEDLCDLLVLGGVLIVDSFVVPIMSVALGALYLCTSRSIGDVILNAVAIAFVDDIDNWILGLNCRVNILAGKNINQTVHIPTNRPVMRMFAWTMTFVPVIPISASLGFCFLGFHVLML